jgi:hypothetical protein
MSGDAEWRTVEGALAVGALERECAALGVRLDRARRTYWQAQGLFPLPEIRRLSEPGGSGGSRGYYHADAPRLALLVDRLLAARGADGARPSPGAVAALLARIAAGSADARDPAAAERAFYGHVRSLLAGPPPALPAPRPRRPPRRRAGRSAWITVAGRLTARELEEACGALGVRLDRARRTYWQAAELFPRPEVRWLSRPGCRGGARGYYHEGAPLLGVLVDYALRPDHPQKDAAWRVSTRGLAALLAEWRAELRAGAADARAAEEAFFARVVREVATMGAPGGLSGIRPAHAEIVPPGQRRLPARRAEDARELAAAVIEALADAWVDEHGEEPEPERLVVWFRVERDGPDDWRIAGRGARRTAAGRRTVAGAGEPQGLRHPFVWH